jgi:hypothetical protein
VGEVSGKQHHLVAKMIKLRVQTSYNQWCKKYCQFARIEAVFKEKHVELDSMPDLTITSPYLIVDSDVQLSTRTTTNADRKGESTRKGEGLLKHAWYCRKT